MTDWIPKGVGVWIICTKFYWNHRQSSSFKRFWEHTIPRQILEYIYWFFLSFANVLLIAVTSITWKVPPAVACHCLPPNRTSSLAWNSPTYEHIVLPTLRFHCSPARTKWKCFERNLIHKCTTHLPPPWVLKQLSWLHYGTTMGHTMQQQQQQQKEGTKKEGSFANKSVSLSVALDGCMLGFWCSIATNVAVEI